jgi:hypothetical protein
MGGPGSGNHYHWHRPEKKVAAEDCLNLNAAAWRREGILPPRAGAAGRWGWTYRNGQTFAVDWRADPDTAGAPGVWLSYRWVWRSTGETDEAAYRVGLTSTALHRGGRRWWFVCPLTYGGRPCGRRVGRLYLPPRARLFGCRACHRLAYTSSQESGKNRALIRSMAGSLGWDEADVRLMMNQIARRGRG